MFIELWGDVAYAEQRVLRKIEASEIEVATERIGKLLMGSRTGTTFWPDVEPVTDTVNVMDFVRAADKTMKGAHEDYVFLCDAAHPSFIPNSHLLFAGAVYDNW